MGGSARWWLRRLFWNVLAWGKFIAARPRNIPLPPATRQQITPRPMRDALPEIGLSNVMVCAREDIPADERSRVNTAFYRFQVWLYGKYSPMQPGLAPVDADAQQALQRSLTRRHRRLFRAPALPAEYLGIPDLGSLAVRGPFAGYTSRTDEDDATWVWDLRMLDGYEHHPGLLKIGARVVFGLDPLRRSLRAQRIECALGAIEASDPRWAQACRIALCAASTHTSLVRHFNWVHLVGGAQLAFATRNSLSPKHPLFRLLWPHVYATHQSNYIVTRGQMSRGGDFESIFSFTFDGMRRLFDEAYLDYPHLVNDPEADGDARGVRAAGFDTPTQDNLEKLFAVMGRYVRNYLQIYYPRNVAVGPDAVHNDAEILDWLDQLNVLIPNGVGVRRDDVTWDSLARLLARQLYQVTVQHELLGSYLWDYQLWTHRQPPRIYQNSQREPLDVHQRLINANFNLNVRRRALMYDFTYIALDDHAKEVMWQFQRDLAALQAELDTHPRPVWRLDPRDLEVNINA
jgi:Lipoxygenase